MTDKLRQHIDGLFKDAPHTQQMAEFREEILQNTIDRYNDLISEGKSPEAAYSAAVSGIGDIGSIIDAASGNKRLFPDNVGYTKDEIDRNRKKRAVLLTAAVMLYILSVVPVIASDLIASDAENAVRFEIFGTIMMFVIIAVATGLIIYRAATKLPCPTDDDTVISEFKQWRREKKQSRTADTICNVIWIVFTVFYVCLSLATKMWSVTWLIFPIIIAVCNVVHAIADLCRK